MDDIPETRDGRVSERFTYAALALVVIIFSFMLLAGFRFALLKEDYHELEFKYEVLTNYDATKSMQLERLEMTKEWEDYLNSSSFLNGVYYHNKYYCVWTKDRSNPSINRTDYHETCHDLVYNDYEHFCHENANKS